MINKQYTLPPLFKAHYLKPDWPAPDNVKAFCSTRLGGISQEPFNSFNLALSVGDNNDTVMSNRQQLITDLALPTTPLWLSQVHGIDAVKIDASTKLNHPEPIKADASITHSVNQVCAIMTADCLPILITNQQGTEVAAIHAGWRGLLNGVIDSTINQLNSAPETLFAWLGPAIGPDHFEVNNDIRTSYIERHAEFAEAFQLLPQDRWFANIYDLATINLKHLGVTQVFGGDFCTYCQADYFYSYRRDANITGRMVSLIWLDACD